MCEALNQIALNRTLWSQT